MGPDRRLAAALALLIAPIALADCGGGPPADPSTPTAHAPTQPTVDAAPSAAKTDCGDAGCAATSPDSTKPSAPSAFSPPPITPPHTRSAQPGDGQWVPVAEAGDVDGQPLMLKTTLRPHPIRKDVYAVIVAVDLTRAELVWMPGVVEPENKTIPLSKRRGMVPSADHERLVAALNGGFMAKHGNFGAMADGDVYLPPRDTACTIAIGKDGSVRVAPWEDLSGSASDFSAWRQTPPCLVHKNELHTLLATDHKKWGLSAEGKFEIRRSALGVDASGRTLLLGLGEWVLPKEIAMAMKLAGAVSAAELDINWSYTRFNFYGKKDGQLQVTSTLVPKLVHTKKSYVGEPAERDFFYIKKKK